MIYYTYILYLYSFNFMIKEMSQMKKITLGIIMIVLAISAAVSVSAETAQDFSWKLTDGVLTISGSGDMPNYGGDAPWASQCSEIKEVVILQGVTSIGDWAFYNCDSLTSVSIPEGVTSIGDDAFRYCSSLASISIPSSVTSIGYDAFRDCSSLTNIEVAENNLSYSSENGVLYNKNKTVLIQYAIGKSNMEFIIPEGVTSIGRGAFSGCSSLTSVSIPEGVTSIGWGAFENCGSLTSISIPSSVTSIGDDAFRDCSSLTSVSIPEDVTSIGWSAFSGCSSLANIEVAENNPNYSSENGVLYNKNKTVLIRYAIGKSDTEFIIPGSVTNIGKHAFEDCSSLTSVSIPEGVTSIGDDAFSRCSSLTSVSIPSSVTSIGDYAFWDCSSLADIYYGGRMEKNL